MNHGSKWICVLSKSSAQKALQMLLSLKCVDPALNGFHALQDQYVEYNLYLELKTKCQASQNVSAQLSAASGVARWPYNHSKRGAWLMGTDKIVTFRLLEHRQSKPKVLAKICYRAARSHLYRWRTDSIFQGCLVSALITLEIATQ